jgi:hypothetical protein
MPVDVQRLSPALETVLPPLNLLLQYFKKMLSLYELHTKNKKIAVVFPFRKWAARTYLGVTDQWHK